MKKIHQIFKVVVIASVLIFVSCESDQDSLESTELDNKKVSVTLEQEATEAQTAKRSSGRLDRNTGRYYAAAGSVVRLTYQAGRRSPCGTGEVIRINAGGAIPYTGVYKSINNGVRGSKTFRIPRSGYVTIRAEIKNPSNPGRGCATGIINVNGHSISISKNTKFPK